jgi:uncharacterized membrane protein HdeD (DUF308 family)
MNNSHAGLDRVEQERWLKTYYFSRAAFSIAWVIAALTVAGQAWGVAAALLVVYPAWDALANLVDAARSGGLSRNRPQALNFVVSLVVAAAVAFALPDMNHVLGVFGTWAILSGALQFATAVRRWKAYGAQWVMVLSGAQSVLSGAVFIFQARTPAVPSIATIAGYAGFGAFYFLLSALFMSVSAWRRQRA